MNPKPRIGLIGAGWWATSVYLPVLTADPRIELAAVNRPEAADLETVRARFKVPAAFTDYREMLKRVPLDGVVVASPHPLHYEHVREALEHGAHVLVDKPMTTNAAEARMLVERARELGRDLVVSYGWNFTSMAREASRLVREVVGEVEHVSVHMASALADLFSGKGLAEASDALFRPAVSTWADPRRAGGYGWGQLTHALGLLFRIVDLEPARVFAVTRLSSAGVDAYDAAVVRFRNGATGTLSGAATVPKHRGFQLDLRIFGSQGMLLLDIEHERLEARRHDRADVVVPLAAGSTAYPAEASVKAFIEICLGNRDAVHDSPGLVGQRAVEVLDAFYRSVASGRPEEITP